MSINVINVAITPITSTADIEHKLIGHINYNIIYYVARYYNSYNKITPTISILLLQELLQYSWIRPIITSDITKSYGSISLINQHLKYGYKLNGKSITIGEKSQLNVCGLMFDWSIPDRTYSNTKTCLDIYYAFVFKHQVKRQLNCINVTNKIMFSNNSVDILSALTGLYAIITYYDRIYWNVLNILKIHETCEIPYFDDTIVNMKKTDVKNPIEPYKTLNKILFFNVDCYETIYSTFKSFQWIDYWDTLWELPLDEFVLELIEKRDANISRYYVDYKSSLYDHYRNTFPDYDDKTINTLVSRSIVKKLLPSEETIKLKMEFEEILKMASNNRNELIKNFESYLKRNNLKFTLETQIFDSTDKPIFCPHVVVSKIYKKSIEAYEMCINDRMYCRICGIFLSNVESNNSNISRSNLIYYTDTDLDSKNYVWKEIIKLLSHLIVKKGISVTGLVTQMTDTLHSLLVRANKRIYGIKTLQNHQKHAYYKMTIIAYIWLLFAKLRMKYSKILKIVGEPKILKLLDNFVYNNVLSSINFDRYDFIDEHKFKVLYLNLKTELIGVPISYTFKVANVTDVYYCPSTNVLVKLIVETNRKLKRSEYSLEKITGNDVWNNLMSSNRQIHSLKVNVTSNSINNYRFGYKSIVDRSNVQFLSYAPDNLNEVYGLIDGKLHRHKWNDYHILPGGAISPKCSICKLDTDRVKKIDYKLFLELQNQILYYYDLHFNVCYDYRHYHEFANNKCKYCDITIDLILNKDYNYFKKHDVLIETKHENTLEPIEKLDLLDKTTKPINNESILIQWINKTIIFIKSHIWNIKPEQFYNLLYNLGNSMSHRNYTHVQLLEVRNIHIYGYLQYAQYLTRLENITVIIKPYNELRLTININNLWSEILIMLCKLILDIKKSQIVIDLFLYLEECENMTSSSTTTSFTDGTIFGLKNVTENEEKTVPNFDNDPSNEIINNNVDEEEYQIENRRVEDEDDDGYVDGIMDRSN